MGFVKESGPRSAISFQLKAKSFDSGNRYAVLASVQHEKSGSLNHEGHKGAPGERTWNPSCSCVPPAKRPWNEVEGARG